MHIVFVEPRFPGNQKQFVRALAEIGATVTAIGEGSKDSLDHELKHWLTHYEEVTNVTSSRTHPPCKSRATPALPSRNFPSRLRADPRSSTRR